MRLKKILFSLILPVTLFAQKQPKVGLVLSGGGVKGFAHIGVIRELEKAGVHLDYVGGTSMGAVVGGLYAAGYDSYQIEKLVLATDFFALIQDKIPRREKTYFEKTYVEKHAFTLPFKKGKLELPKGLSKGQNALNLLTELFAPVDHITDFSKLPIPFYCIGTDIETGEEIVLENGSIPLAVRASSSFPSLINPVEVNGRLLVDGGVVNNFPADVMKKKGMDIIIGVDVQGELSEREDLTSIAEILGQIINFQMYSKSDEHIKLINIHIEPNVKEYTTTSFNKRDEIIAQGKKEAKSFSSAFKEIAKQQQIKKKIPEIIFERKKFLVDRIIVKGNKNYKRNYILGKLQLKEGDSVSYKDVSSKINTLTATNNFERIDYYFNDSFKGKKLTLSLKEDQIKSFLRIGLHYDELYESGVLLNYNNKKLLFSNDELSFDVVFGDNLRYDLQYFIDNGFIPSYGFSSRFNTFSSNFRLNTENVNKINLEYNDFTTKLFTQTTLDKKFAIGGGIEHKKIRIKTETILTNGRETFFDNSNYFIPYAFLRLDTFDRKIFPTKGFFIDLNSKWYLYSDRNNILDELAESSGAFVKFSQLNGTVSGAFNFKKKLTFQYSLEAGYTVGQENSQVFYYRLGGYNKNYINNFKSFYGYEIGGLGDQSFLKAGLDVRYQFFKKQYVLGGVNFARVENNAFAFDFEKLFGVRKTGYAVGYSIETLVGPIELKYTWSPDHSDNFLLFNLGFWF